MLIGSYAFGQSKNLYKLSKPIQAFDTTYEYIKWQMIDYPLTNKVYWCVVKDTSLNLCVIDGTYLVPQNIVSDLGNDNNAISKYLEQIKVWANKK